MMTSCKRTWPVLLLCCVMVFNTAGIHFGMGAVFTDIMGTFHVSRATASLVQSVTTGFVFGGGIFSGHLLQWQGPRVMVLVGSALATAGCVTAFLATHIVQVIVGIGVIAGLGNSFTYLTAQTLPGVMFHNIKSMAVSIVGIAAAVGSAVYPLLLRHITNRYSVRGTFLILAAVNCQLILCGALIGLYTSRRSPAAVGENAEREMEDLAEVGKTPAVEEKARNLVVEETGPGIHLHEKKKGNRQTPAGHVQESELIEDNVIAVVTGEKIVKVSGESPKITSRLLHKSFVLPCSDEAYPEGTTRVLPYKSQEVEQNPHETSLDDARETYEDTVEVVSDAEDFKPSPPLLSQEADTTSPSSRTYDCNVGNKAPGICRSLSEVRNALSKPFQLFRNVRFFVLCVLGGSTGLFFPLPWMFMTDMVKANNLSLEDGSFFITILFVGNLTGRMLGGVLYKLLKSRIQILPSVATATGGVTCLLFVFCTDYTHFVIVSLILGVDFGLMSSTCVMSVLEIVGPRRYGVGIGYLAFCFGVFFLLAGPYGGLIRDLTNSYEPVYYIAIIHGSVIGAVLLFTSLRYLWRL